MRRKFLKLRRSGSRLEDTVRVLLALIIALLSVATFTNRGPIYMDVEQAVYEAYITQGALKEAALSPEGISLMREWVVHRSSPTINPVAILWQRVNFDGRPEAFEMVTGVTTQDTTTLYYGIYQKGRRLYLRVEPYGSDRILTTDFTPEELETALTPFIKG